MTIREIAKLVNVSPAAVSIVLNGKKGVSEETRKKILEAIEVNHYSPAVKKSNKTSQTVLMLKYYKSGMFIEENQGFISMIVDAIEGQLRRENLGMTLMVAKDDLQTDLKSIDYGQYCGMIVVATEITEDNYELLGSIPIPFVIVDNTFPNYSYSTVCMNNHENVWMALDYIHKCGHRKIGYLGSSSKTENFKARYEAFRMYIKEFGLDFSTDREFRVKPTLLGAHDDFLNILGRKPELPTCFFAENDTIALGVMKALREKGYKIPADISVVGVDDIPYASISSPPLTTIHVQRNIIGKQCVNQLLQLIDDERFMPMKTQITGRLVVRDSVRDLNSI